MNTVIFKGQFDHHGYAYTPFDGVSQQAATDRQFKWLKKQLSDAKTNNDLVYLAMHIPPGIDGFSGHPMWDDALMHEGQPVQDVFLDLVDTYQDQIAGVLSGHTHLDGIRRLYGKPENGTKRYLELCIGVPGITTDHGNNPGMKVFTYAPSDKFEIRDFTTHYATDEEVLWRLNESYSFRSAYPCKACPVDASLTEWVAHITDDDELFRDMESILNVKHRLRSPKSRFFKQAMSVNYSTVAP
jgi:3',5'-cyclic AMP phosphodiesterase CpdA